MELGKIKVIFICDLVDQIESVIRASVGEWGLSRTKVCSGAVCVLRVAISGSRQEIGGGRDLR
jgi:hypothetical protein